MDQILMNIQSYFPEVQTIPLKMMMTFIGIIGGESLVRSSLLLQHCLMKRRIWRILKKLISVKILVLVAFSVMILKYLFDNMLFDAQHSASIAFVWIAIRFADGFHNIADDMKVLDDHQANVGPGLAANYWFSFLEHVMNANFRKVMEEHCKELREELLKSRIEEQSANITVYPKLVIVLPSNCSIDKAKWESEEGIFKHVPGACHPTCENQKFEGKYSRNHDIPIQLESRKQNVHIHWIFKYEEDEKEFVNGSLEERAFNSKEKILVALDFPQLLKSCMGPGPSKGWDDRPGARHKNLKMFKKFISGCIDAKFLTHREDVVFLSFCNNSLRNEKLSSMIRRMISVREMIASSSGSDSEA